MNQKRIKEIVEIYFKNQPEEVKKAAMIVAENVERETRAEAAEKVFAAASQIANS